jgi:DNA-binding NarL/FixJ family response regulator
MSSATEKIRVLLADDHRLFRDSLKLLLKDACEVVGEADNGETAVVLAAQLKPHVVILDLGMAGVGGLAAAHQIARRAPSVKVLILSQFDDEEYVLEAFNEAGAAGYIHKGAAGEELMTAVRSVHAGNRYVSPTVAPILLEQLNRPAAERDPRGARLTRREREVIRMVAQGATTKEIAARLKISPKTAQVHRDNLRQKLDLRSTAAIVRYAIKHKLVQLD